MSLDFKTDVLITSELAYKRPPIPLGGGGASYAWVASELTGTDGTAVQTWTDSIAGAKLTTTGTGALLATGANGKKVVNFTTAASLMSATGVSLGGSYTVLIIAERPTSNTRIYENGNRVLDLSSGKWIMNSNPGGQGLYIATLGGASSTPVAAIARMGLNPDLRVSGTSVDTATKQAPSTAATSGTLKVGRSTDSASGTAIHLVALWNRLLTDAELDDIMSKARANYAFLG